MVKRAPSTVSTVSSGETIEIVRSDFDTSRDFPKTHTHSNPRMGRTHAHGYNARNSGYRGVHPGSSLFNSQSRLFHPAAFSHGGMRSIFEPLGALSHDPFSSVFGTMSPFHFDPPFLWDSQFGGSAFDFGHSSVWPTASRAARDMREFASAHRNYEHSASTSINQTAHPERHARTRSELPSNFTMRMRASVMTRNYSASDGTPKQTYRETTAAYKPKTGWHGKTTVGDESGFRTYVWR